MHSIIIALCSKEGLDVLHFKLHSKNKTVKLHTLEVLPSQCIVIISILLSTEGDAFLSGCWKSSECSAAVGGGVVGGFVGGVLMSAVVAAVIFVVFAQRMRSVHMRICSSLLVVLFLLVQS